MDSFPPEVREELRSYVYMYVDPRDDRPFYVGKGVKDRAFNHLSDLDDCEKVKRITEIREAGREPKIEILRHGLTEDQAALVEASVIDAIGLRHLTNLVRGQHSQSFGRTSVEDVLLAHTAPPTDVEFPCLLITINRLYRSGMDALELYEATRGIWKAGLRREKAKYAMAVFQGVVREVYAIDEWFPGGTVSYTTRNNSELKTVGRWEFEGHVATEHRDKYLRKSVRHLLGASNQNPIRYVNC